MNKQVRRRIRKKTKVPTKRGSNKERRAVDFQLATPLKIGNGKPGLQKGAPKSHFTLLLDGTKQHIVSLSASTCADHAEIIKEAKLKADQGDFTMKKQVIEFVKVQVAQRKVGTQSESA